VSFEPKIKKEWKEQRQKKAGRVKFAFNKNQGKNTTKWKKIQIKRQKNNNTHRLQKGRWKGL